MYQCIRILELVCPINGAPYHHLHDKKGWVFFISDSTKMVNLIITFLLLRKFPPNWISTWRDMSYLLWFNFMFLGHLFANLFPIRSQVNVWHQTASECHTSLQLLKQGPQLVLGQLVLLACHSWNSWKLFKMPERSLEETVFPSASSVLC